MSQRFLAIQRILGVIIVLSSLTKLPPAFLALAWGESETPGVFFGSFMVSFLMGMALWFPARNVNYEMRLRDGFLIVTMTWVFASLVSALPFVHGPPHLSYTDAIFEATSGLTTTGATVMMVTHDVDEAVLLSDRIVMMTNGPAATIGEVLRVDLPRPRDRVALAEDRAYVQYRKEVIDFLYMRHSHVEKTT